MSEAAQKYAIDLKENARELSNIANELSGSDGHGMVFKKSAVSDNPDAVTATFIGDSSSADDTSLDIEVRQLATSQINTDITCSLTAAQLREIIHLTLTSIT